MKPKPFSYFLMGLFVLLFYFALPPTLTHGALSKFMPDIVDKVEEFQGGWTILTASLKLDFVSDEKSASCHGSLLYHRLDEKIRLLCTDPSGRLLFAFKTTDREFEIFIPGQKSLYQGNIFELEGSPEIESHLKPLALYRALKLMTILRDRTKISEWNEEKVILNVSGYREKTPYLARQIIVTGNYEIPAETYYNFEEKPALIIQRSDYRQIEKRGLGRTRKLNFPHAIMIEDVEAAHRKTVLSFEKLEFPPSAEEKEWQLQIPDGTKRVEL